MRIPLAAALAIVVTFACTDQPLTSPDALSVSPQFNMGSSAGDLTVSAVRAPVAPDGATAGAVTDIVLTFVDRDPAVDGIGMKSGGTIEVVLADDFVNTGAGGDVGVVLQGWPQSPPAPPPAFPWTSTIAGNTITVELTADWMPGDFGPGPKQVHLILFGFRNPSKPGPQHVHLAIQPDPAGPEVLTGHATVNIIPKARPSVNVISLFSGPPGPPPPFFNPFYQTIVQGDAARQVGLYLWASRSAPYLGVDIVMDGGAGARHGRLVQDGSTVGHVWIDAPPGASDFTLSTGSADDPPPPCASGPSCEVPAFITGVPVGLMLVQFDPDPAVTGDYQLTIRMNNGNTEELFFTVVPD